MPKRPNIVFFMTDSWDGRVLGCMGHPVMRNATPNADALAARGALLRNAYTSHPICCPARANMWSGTYTHRCESWNNHKGLEPGTRIFKHDLEAAGYVFGSELGGFGKHDYYSGKHTHMARVSAWTGPADLPVSVKYMPRPPQIVEEPDGRDRADWRTVAKAVDFLEERAESEDPFFLYISTGQPHPPFRTHREYLDLLDLDAVTIPPEDESDHPVMAFQRRNKDWTFGFEDDLVREIRDIYYAKCAATDAMLGRVLAALARLGLDEETYVVLSSDHGENNMEHRQWYKMNHYESSARVPLIVAGPGIVPGQQIDNIVSIIDFYPTFLDMAGVDSPAGLDGESLMPLLRGNTTASRDWAFASSTGTTLNTTAWMLRKGEWKYIAYPGYEPQLFNLDEDPEEIRNVASECPEVAAGLDAELCRIVDYQEADARCQAYNRTSFRAWREIVRSDGVRMKEYGMDCECASYEQAMGNIYPGFNEDHDRMLDEWLERDA